MRLSEGQTAQPFDGEVLVTLHGIKFEGDPLRHRVYGSVGKTGRSNKDFGGSGVDPGFSIVYEGFEIRILSVDTFVAEVKVTRLNPDLEAKAINTPR